MFEILLEFSSEKKDLEYHKEDRNFFVKYPNPELNQNSKIEVLQKYYLETNIILPKGKDMQDKEIEFLKKCLATKKEKLSMF